MSKRTFSVLAVIVEGDNSGRMIEREYKASTPLGAIEQFFLDMDDSWYQADRVAITVQAQEGVSYADIQQ